jgi:DNA gyrase/topoisomerase IV subunit A
VRGIRLRSGDENVGLIVLPSTDLATYGIIDAVDAEAEADAEEVDESVIEETGAELLVEGDDETEDSESSRSESRRTVLTITANGFGKRTRISDYPVQKRGGLGVITIKTSDRNGKVVSARLVAEDDQLIIITDKGKIIRTRVSDVPVLSRNTQGVTLISLEKEEQVVGIAKFAERDDEDDEFDGEGHESETDVDGEVIEGEVVASSTEGDDGANTAPGTEPSSEPSSEEE